MIEVEKKFTLTKEQEENLKKDAIFVSKKEIVDTYFDNENYDLTKNDLWLRERNGQFELKVSQDKNIKRYADHYDEIEDEEEIRNYLKINKNKSICEDIKNAGYLPFATLKTIRSKYKINKFNIDMDEVTSKNFFYGLAEIELMIEDNNKIDNAIAKIMKFAKKYNLHTNVHTRGKLIEYIRKSRPEHFNTLVNLGVVK